MILLYLHRLNERVKIRGKFKGYLGGQKWRPREEWVIKQNTHEPLITEEIADSIKQIKDRDLRGAPYDKKVYPLKASTGAWEVSSAEIKAIISNLAKEVDHADPKIKKRVFQTLFREVQIFPKEGCPWKRRLEIKGVYLPLTGVFVESPRGFEPLSSRGERDILGLTRRWGR